VSSRGIIALVCDEPGCTKRYMALQPVEDARAEAAGDGWVSGVRDDIGVDFCPDHVESAPDV